MLLFDAFALTMVGSISRKPLETYLLEHHIFHEYSNPHDPFQNGRAERSIGLIGQMARSFLLTACLPPHLWNYAVLHATEVLNRVPTRTHASKGFISPFEALYSRPPDLRTFWIFGCLVYVYRHKKLSDDWKQDPRGIPCVFLGHGEADGSKAVIVYNLQSHAIHYTTQYQIDETFFPCRPKTDRRITSCEFGSYPDSPSDPPQPVPSPALDARLEVTRSESVPVTAVRPAASSEVTVPVSPVHSSSAIWDVISYDASTDSYLVRSGSTDPC